MGIKDRDDDRLEITPSIHRIGHDAAFRAFGHDAPTAKERHELLEYLRIVSVLIDLKARAYQPTGTIADRRMRPDAHTETSFAIDESCHVIRRQPSYRPSLLVVRTGTIVTP